MSIELEHHPVSKTNPARVALTVKSEGQSVFTDQLDISKLKARKGFIGDLVKECPGLSQHVETLDKKLLEIADQRLTNVNGPEPDDQDHSPLAESKRQLTETPKELVYKAKEFLGRPELVDLIAKHIEILGLVGEPSLGLALYLINTSRLLVRPLSGIVLGTSSSGKSHATLTVGKLFPAEAVYQAHRITPSALNYLPQGSLVHRAVIGGERSRKQDDDQAEATRALREMIGDGVLRLLVTGKDEKGNLTTFNIEQPGPISYMESTTLGLNEIFDEDKTRFLFLCVDETKQQNQRVIRSLIQGARSPRSTTETESLVSLHHTVQRLLEPCEVLIPFADRLEVCLPADRTEVRRAFGHLLGLIRAVGLLHQYQRNRDDAGRLIATVDDYDVVRRHLTEPIARGLGVCLTAGADRLREVIEEGYEYNDRFTAHDLQEKTGLGKVVYDRLKELRSHGIIEVAEPGSGNVPAKYKRGQFSKGLVDLELPDLKNVCSLTPTGNAETKCQVLV